MKPKRKVFIGISAALLMLAMICDSKNTISGAYDGVEICFKTVIPALFPFLFISILLNGNLGINAGKFLRPLAKICRIPSGCESILLLGFLGGYPVGAKCITEYYCAGSISKKDAQRMLGFCNNAGPAFIFGMVGTLFHDIKLAWILWGIHILSALITGMLIPGRATQPTAVTKNSHITITDAIESSIRTMLTICSWVILFRVFITLLEKWLLWILPQELHILIAGILELSNGIVMLNAISVPGMRFVLAAFLLGLGGICVMMQTHSVVGCLGISYYFPGKLMHGIISVILACIVQSLVFPGNECWHFSSLTILLIIPIFIISAFFKYQSKKVVAFC